MSVQGTAIVINIAADARTCAPPKFVVQTAAIAPFFCVPRRSSQDKRTVSSHPVTPVYQILCEEVSCVIRSEYRAAKGGAQRWAW